MENILLKSFTLLMLPISPFLFFSFWFKTWCTNLFTSNQPVCFNTEKTQQKPAINLEERQLLTRWDTYSSGGMFSFCSNGLTLEIFPHSTIESYHTGVFTVKVTGMNVITTESVQDRKRRSSSEGNVMQPFLGGVYRDAIGITAENQQFQKQRNSSSFNVL